MDGCQFHPQTPADFLNTSQIVFAKIVHLEKTEYIVSHLLQSAKGKDFP